MFEMFKGVKHQFNACTEEVSQKSTAKQRFSLINDLFFNQSLNVLLDKINCFADNDANNELTFSCVGKTLEAMANFTKREHSALIWRCFYVIIITFIVEYKDRE